ncbi:unnamed protein product [Penicillium roqueforti FM164]|uniref:Genomic scaffold, ProqFM164S04 n=1 Tax=Penicillium roqueforti (strain FM164) TaxID=1365484 RepID=W6QI29_PENRF|nr:unnamed protein product [Penicillium roqueforti FM164]
MTYGTETTCPVKHRHFGFFHLRVPDCHKKCEQCSTNPLSVSSNRASIWKYSQRK